MEKATQADISGHISAMLSHICGVYDKGAFKYDITPGGGGVGNCQKSVIITI